ncbi:uncharacterized protein LOC133333309 [Musca vetustissima]|uniref:uncharacterized protein LOC133333309 n=1 Tax=Musca vetustissima TaxID=27455 RepID=UPI002AB75434|nr:uncharacterized protein LOC133333309 [Musca vetustissima]
MAIYDVPTDGWDPILVFLCLQRLPKQTVTLWEQSVKNKSALSSWNDLDNFLTERVQTLTCLRDIKGIDDSKKVDSKKVRTHFTNASSSRSTCSTTSNRSSPEKSCVLCPSQSHHLRSCPEFRNRSLSDRFSLVKRHHCCINCLSRGHDVKNCSSTHSCAKFNRRHRTLLHREAFPVTITASNIPPSSHGPSGSKILLQGMQSNILGSLIAQNTVFGWIITGPISASNIRVFSTNVAYSEEDNINKTLLRFWELEEVPKRSILSPADKYCEENYKKTTRRDSNGRYIVTLPIKPEFFGQPNLGHSRANCLRQFIRNEASLLKKPNIKQIYDGVVKEYLELDHMKSVPVPSANSTVCYLPHHPVINPEKQTTKLRVVFNASNKTSNGNSLNDVLYVGPTLQLDLVLLILRWRVFKYVFNCDITQMYRQILVDSAHTPLQRILFRDSPDKPIQDFELKTVTFGVNCAPYLAIRTLLQLADDTEDKFPLAAHILRKCMYVDDVLTGYHNLETAHLSRDQLIRVLSSAKFELRKWTSNDRSILECLPAEHLIDTKLLDFVEASSSKPLGIRWNAQLDVFYFNVKPLTKKSTYTKREVLSTIAKLFDPIGWLGPVLIVAKIIMQRIWLDHIDWDDSLPSTTEGAWQKFVETYQDVNFIQIPRWVNYVPDCSAELHIFSDASEGICGGGIHSYYCLQW